jgi:multimeric flavodoxin WrbA
MTQGDKDAPRRLLLHDLGREEAAALLQGRDLTVFGALPMVTPCTGCFGCWVKTPGACVTKDRASVFPGLLSRHDELIVVSRLTIGGFSPEVKAVMERSLSYLLPFFRVRGGISTHPKRHGGELALRAAFYGEGTPAMTELAEGMVRANSLNMGARAHGARFFPDKGSLRLPC